MKAVMVETLTGPDDVVVKEIPAPGPPGPGEVKVAILARGVSFTDVLMARGEYQAKPSLPFVMPRGLPEPDPS